MITEAVLMAVSALLFLAVFVRCRRRAYPSSLESGLQQRQEAVAEAARAVERCTGIEVSGWAVFATVWSDEETLARLHRLGKLDELRSRLEGWGLIASWRVRFVGPGATAFVGLAPTGDVTAFDVATRTNDRSAPLSDDCSPDGVVARLGGGAGALWSTARFAGSGEVTVPGAERESTFCWFAEAGGVRVRLTAHSRGATIVHVTVEPEIVALESGGVARSEAWEAAFHAGGFLSGLVALVSGVSILAFSERRATDWRVGVALAVALLTALALTERQRFEMATVHAYDVDAPWVAYRSLHLVSSLVADLAMAAVAFVGASAGLFIAEKVGVDPFDDPLAQAGAGVALGLGWLALVASAYALLRGRGSIRVAPELSPRSMALAGHTWRQAVSISAQSAIGEETVFRLLGISVVWWLTGRPWLGVVVTAALWAATHAGGAVEPRWVRALELTVIGCLLGAAFVQWGFVTVLVAHFVSNLVLLAAPLVTVRRAPAPSLTNAAEHH